MGLRVVTTREERDGKPSAWLGFGLVEEHSEVTSSLSPYSMEYWS